MSYSIIAAIDTNMGIGYNNKLLCYLPADLAWFKKNTSGKTIIMGKNTFLSLPNGALPNRRNLVLSTSQTSFTGAETFDNLPELTQNIPSDAEHFVIGGASIYKLFLPEANKLYLTHIHHIFKADVYFPAFNQNEWELIEKTDFESDEKNRYNYTFAIYHRKK